MQLNFDATVATPCHYLTVDVRDAVGDRLHISDEFAKDGTTFEIGEARRLRNLRDYGDPSASRMVRDARRGWRAARFAKTTHLVEDGPACRVYGSMQVKKVTGNLHIVRQRCSVSRRELTAALARPRSGTAISAGSTRTTLL